MDGGSYRLIALFARHPTAANLLMILMLIGGIFSLGKLNTQFFPDFSVPVITVKVSWPGASAEDVESIILDALEPQLRFLDGVDSIGSVAREGFASIGIEFVPHADMQKALGDVQQAVDSVTTLPEDAETPVISHIQRYDRVANISVSGPYDERAIRGFARQIRDGLLDAGIDKIDFVGMRNPEIEVLLSDHELRRTGLTLADIARRISEDSRDLPSGILQGSLERQLRSLASRKTAKEIGQIEVKTDQSGNRILLQDIARIKEGFDDDSLTGMKNARPAIELIVRRSLKADTLKSLEILREHLAGIRPALPANLDVQLYNVRGDHVVKRLQVLVKNGLQGLVLVLIILFLFLNARIAFWVAAGIPVALMATFAVMYVTGQSINMVSMFALIMMLGIIVDDAIVVAEHTATRQALGDTRLQASITGAGRMLTPVMAATLTTLASFFPMILITGRLGDIMGTMPLVVMAVLIASIIECFFILPGHLRHGFGKMKKQPGRFRAWFDGNLEKFRQGPFDRFVRLCYDWRYSTLAMSLISLFVVVGLIAGGHINVRRFPSPPPEQLRMGVEFSVGTPRAAQIRALQELDSSLYETERILGGKRGVFIVSSFTTMGSLGRDRGDNLAEIEVQLTSSEQRSQGDRLERLWQRLAGRKPQGDKNNLTARHFMKAWRKNRPRIAGIERLTLSARRFGPGGKDVHIQLQGAAIGQLKKASEALKPLLAAFPGVSSVEDDLPYGKPELVLELTSRGRSLGFTAQNVGTQLRNAFQGAVARRFARDNEEITVRVRRDQQDRGLGALEQIFLRSPSGADVPLTQIVSITEKTGFSLIKHENGQRMVSVTADLDTDKMEVPELIEQLDKKVMPRIMADYGVRYQYSGAASERKRNFGDMQKGALVALALIYIILAWVFGHYGRPLAVMAIIPFGLVGAVFGHMIMGVSLTMVSMVGLLGLSGILVNDSIILVSTAKERQDRGQGLKEAAIGAARDRLRAVVLTSLTTIVGLVPLLFETSRQAAFLIPMAITMVFGLLSATILVLVLVPSLLGIGNDIARMTRRLVDLYRPAPAVRKKT